MLVKKYCWVCAAQLLSRSAQRYAHGPQMQITATDGKIITRDILTDVYEPLTPRKSVYVMEVLDYRGVWYARPEIELNPPDHPSAPGDPTYYSGPGIAFGVGQTFAEGSVLSLDFADGLRLWDGNSFADAGATQLQYFRGGSIGAAGQLINPTASILTEDGASSPLMSFSALTMSYPEGDHSTARLRFLGDGSTTTVGSGPQTGTVAN